MNQPVNDPGTTPVGKATNGKAELMRASADAREAWQRLGDDVDALIGHLADVRDAEVVRLKERAGESLRVARESAGRGVQSARDTTQRAVQSARDSTQRAVQAADGYVRRQPWPVIGSIAVIGFALGALLGRRRLP